MGEVPSYITRVILFVSAADMIPLSVSQRSERRIGVRSQRHASEEAAGKAEERKMQFDLRERIRD